MSVGLKANVDGTSGAVQVNGNDVVTVNSSGNVGIGTSSPSSKLELGSGSLRFSGTGQRILGDFSNATAANRVLFQSSGTNQSTAVGVVPNGTGTQTNLVVYNSPDPDNAAFTTLVSTATEARIASSASGTGVTNPLLFTIAGVERMRLDTSGNVGIGTSNPAGYKVRIVGASGTAQFRAGTDANGYFEVNAFDSNPVYCLVAGANATAGVFGTQTNIPAAFFTNNTERMRIDSAGNVGIGTANPNAKLDVVVGADQRLLFTERGTGGAVIDAVNAANSAYKLMVLNASQLDVQISASTKFSLAATSGTITSLPTYNNTAAGSTVVVTSTGLIRRTSSSIKYKKDVESLDPALATNAIEGLRPVWYRTKNPEGDDKATWSHIGLIAEEVHEVEPRLVRYRTAEVIDEQKPVLDEAGEPVLDEEGNPTFTTERVERELAVPEPEDVDYARLSVLLLAEVKELRARVAALEAK